MSRCRLCDRKSLFLSVSRDGLCKNCQPIVEMDVRQRVRIMQDSLEIINKSKKLDTRISRCELFLDHASKLLMYENKSIPTMEPLPSRLIQKYGLIKDNIINEGLEEEVEKALSNAELAATPKTKINNANKALLKIREYKKELNNHSKAETLDSRIKKFTHETQLNSFLEKARKYEFKGQKKKALDQYQEALFFIKNDNIDDDLQKREIVKLEEKIAELQVA